MLKNNFKTKAGYTIIETMIAISLFLVIVMTGMGALLNANLLHQKSRDMRSILDNLSFVMEDMSKNLRTGSVYRCYSAEIDPIIIADINTPRDCVNGWGIAFESPHGVTENNNDQWVYYIGSLYGDGKTGIFKSEAGGGADSFYRMTPDEVEIDTENSSFIVSGALPGISDSKQPFITVKLVGKITYKNIETPFSLQTSVSQRLLDK